MVDLLFPNSHCYIAYKIIKLWQLETSMPVNSFVNLVIFLFQIINMHIFLIPMTLFITSSWCFTSVQDNLDLPEKMLSSLPFSINECDPEMLGFELITGNVFSAPGNVLDPIPGTLMLTDCLETCQGNDYCQSVNYETGLCVLFSSTADLLPGKFSIGFRRITFQAIENKF